VTVAPDESHDCFVSENARGSVGNSGVEGFVQHRLELLDHNFDGQVVVAVEFLSRVNLLHLQRPLSQVHHFVAQVRKLHVRTVFPELVDAFLCEYRLDEVVAVGNQYLRDKFDDKHSHLPPEQRRKQVPPGVLIGCRLSVGSSSLDELVLHVAVGVEEVLDDVCQFGLFEELAHKQFKLIILASTATFK